MSALHERRLEHTLASHVHRDVDTGEFFFSDETESLHGPYTTQAEAEDDLTAYCHWLDTGELPA